jgi:hypothetical protein
MPIYSGSRYEDSTVDYFNKKEYQSTTPIVFYSPDSLASISFFTHSYIPGETLWGLADRYMKRPDLWWAIVEYNPEIVDFINIPSGTMLRIPSV